MRDHHGCAPFDQSSLRFTNFEFGVRIDTRSRLIQNQKAGTMRQRPRKADQLLLASGKTLPPLAHGLRESPRKALHEIEQVHLLGRLFDTRVVNAFGAQTNIRIDGTGKKIGILQNHPEMPPQVFQLELANVGSADTNRPLAEYRRTAAAN